MEHRDAAIGSRDFAVRRLVSDGVTQWNTDRPPTSSSERTTIRASSFPTRLTQSVRSGLSKVKSQTSAYIQAAGDTGQAETTRLTKAHPSTHSSSSLFVPKCRQHHRLQPPVLSDLLQENAANRAMGEVSALPSTPDKPQTLRKSESGQLTEIFVTPKSSIYTGAKDLA